jgi:hypothetical protein
LGYGRQRLKAVAQRKGLHFLSALLQAFKMQGAEAWPMAWREGPAIPAQRFQEGAKESQEEQQALRTLL